jgi:hypothetical protein
MFSCFSSSLLLAALYVLKMYHVQLDLFPSSGEGGKTPTLLGPLERASLNHWKLEANPVSKTLYFLVFRILDDGQSPETQ